MNLPQSPNTLVERQDDDEIDLLGLLDILIESRWLILGVTALVLLLGGAYAFLSRPVYEANTLIQVEDSKPGAAGALGEAASLFDIKSPATAEIEILRSRLVIGQAVDQLQLYVFASPRYLPLVGRWLSGYATGLSNPGFLGMGGYVSGTESIRIAKLDVPASLEGVPLRLIATDGGYQVYGPDGGLLVTGQIGQLNEFDPSKAKGSILVTSLQGKAGAHFTVRRDSRLLVIEDLQSRMVIDEKGKQSGVIGVTLRGPQPELIARTLSAVGTLYVRQNVDRKAAEADKSLLFLDGFLPQLKRQLENSEGKFTDFRNKNGTFNLSAEGELVLKQAVDLQTNLLALQQKRKELQAMFTAEHPSIKTIDAQITTISREISLINSKVKTLPNVEQDTLRLTRDVKVNNELYIGLLSSAQQLRLVREGKVGNVRVVDPPVIPEIPVQPKRTQILAISAVLGFLLALGLAFLRNSLRPGIKDPSDIESVGLHVFATVPFSPAQQTLYRLIDGSAPGSHVLATSHPEDPGVESLRSLRTALQFAMLDATNNLVLVSGPTPGLGKSFISINFAAVLGASNKRVLLIDADMRRGHLHKYFGQQRGSGLSDLITGGQTLEQTLRLQVVPNVDFLSTGTLPPNPGELLLSPAMKQLLQSFSEQYDLVIIDTPPVLAVSDTQVLTSSVGTVFLVARANMTSLGELQESTKRLAQSGSQVKGVVFNALDTTRQRYGGYGYKYSRYRYTNYQYGKRSS